MLLVPFDNGPAGQEDENEVQYGMPQWTFIPVKIGNAIFFISTITSAPDPLIPNANDQCKQNALER